MVTDKQEQNEEVNKSLMNGRLDGFNCANCGFSSFQVFLMRIKNDAAFKKKIIIFICICYAFISLGMQSGQFGPTLLDLQRITGCTLDQAAFFFNAITVGYLVSSLLIGLIFERFNKLLQILLPSLLTAFVAAAIPFCSVYEVMVLLHFLKGVLLGLIGGGGNALVMHLLSLEAKTYLQILHFMFAFGGIISPLISAPFLSEQNEINHTVLELHMNHSLFSESDYRGVIRTKELTTLNITLSPNYENSSTSRISNSRFKDKQLYIAYIITAILSLTSAMPFLFLYFNSEKTTCPTSNKEDILHKKEKISICIRISVLMIICCITGFYTAVDGTFAGFLVTFTVKYFKWKKARGSFATSVFWTSFAVGRFFGIFIINFIKQVNLLCIYSIVVISSFVCMLVTAIHGIDKGIWVTSGIVGFGMSVFSPIFFSWTEEKFFHVDGKVTSLMMACASLGVIINPIILSKVLDRSPIWFCYILLVESGMLFLFFILSIYVARLVKQERFSYGRDEEIVADKSATIPLQEV